MKRQGNVQAHCFVTGSLLKGRNFDYGQNILISDSGTFVRLGEAGPMTGSAFVLLHLLFANLHRDALKRARSEILIPT